MAYIRDATVFNVSSAWGYLVLPCYSFRNSLLPVHSLDSINIPRTAWLGKRKISTVPIFIVPCLSILWWVSSGTIIWSQWHFHGEPRSTLCMETPFYVHWNVILTTFTSLAVHEIGIITQWLSSVEPGERTTYSKHTEKEMSFWRKFHHWLQRKLSF